MIFANVGALLFTIFHSRGVGQYTWFLFLEALINAVLIFEVSMRIVAYGKEYFALGANIFDLVVCILCILSFTGFLLEPSPELEAEDIATLMVRILRDLVRLLRLIALIRRRHEVDDGEALFSLDDVELESDAESIDLSMEDSGDEHSLSSRSAPNSAQKGLLFRDREEGEAPSAMSFPRSLAMERSQSGEKSPKSS